MLKLYARAGACFAFCKEKMYFDRNIIFALRMKAIKNGIKQA
jgi:hypothetical protein